MTNLNVFQIISQSFLNRIIHMRIFLNYIGNIAKQPALSGPVVIFLNELKICAGKSHKNTKRTPIYPIHLSYFLMMPFKILFNYSLLLLLQYFIAIIVYLYK